MTTKQQAFNLYFQSNLTQQQIADMLDINRKTLYTWIRAGEWKRARHTARHAPTLLVQQYYDQLTAMNAHIAARTEQPFPTKDEADVMRKLSMVIKQLRNSWTPSDMMDIFTLFQSDLVRSGQIDKATELMPLLDNFVQKSSVGSRSYEPLREYYDGQTEDEEYERWLSEQQQLEEGKPINMAAQPAKKDVGIENTSSNPETSGTAAHSSFEACLPIGRGVGRLDTTPSAVSDSAQSRDCATTPPAPGEQVRTNVCLPADRQVERPHRVEMGHAGNSSESHNALKDSKKEQIAQPESTQEKIQNGALDAVNNTHEEVRETLHVITGKEVD